VVTGTRAEMKLRIGTRGSALALWQTHHVRDRLLALEPRIDIEIIVIQTTGDRVTDVALSRIGDKGLFTRELDRAVIDGDVDLAVHSLKDVPTTPAEGLDIAAVLERIDPRDALVVAPGMPRTLRELPPRATVGTSSLRRRAQLLALRPDLIVEDLRGNLDTRLRRVENGDYHAAILAFAGMRRLQFDTRIAETLDPPDWLPAAGQGALAITTRTGDAVATDIVGRLDHPPTRAATTAERAFLGALEGGCQIPIGALAAVEDSLRLDGLVASIDGTAVVRGSVHGAASDATLLGRTLAQQLLDRGADRILADLRAQNGAPRPASP